MRLSIDNDFLHQTLARMVQINSTNPSLTPGSPGEAVLGQFVADTLSTLGLNVTIHMLDTNRVNVVGILKGKGGGKSLMLNGHLDTVGVDGMEEPFSARIEDGRSAAAGCCHRPP